MKLKNENNFKKIAELTGFSPSTISMVLNNKSDKFRIAEKTSERILQAANEIGYQHVIRAKQRKKNFKKMLLCVFCPSNFDKGPIDQFYTGFKKYIIENHLQYETVLFPYELGKFKEKAAWVSGDFIAGAVLIVLTEDDLVFIENTRFDVPLVLFNRTAKGYSSVLIDDYNAGNNAMSHFLKRGHKKFGIICANYSSRSLSLRTVGYLDKFRSLNFKPEEAFLSPAAFDDDSDMGGYNAMQQILQSQKIPTAIFVPCDNMVNGVIRCINENGFKVPDDFEIISYGNKSINCIVNPNVSSFAPPWEEMSYNCAKILNNYIKNGIYSDCVKLSFEAECIYRESCPAVP